MVPFYWTLIAFALGAIVGGFNASMRIRRKLIALIREAEQMSVE